MDTTILRTFLEQGRCLLRDVDEVLKQRSDKRLRQAWMQQASAAEANVCHVCEGSNQNDYDASHSKQCQS